MLMQNLAGNPEIMLDIKPEGIFEFWSHITVVDELGRTTFQQRVNNAAQVPLGRLDLLKDSILNVTGVAQDAGGIEGAAINYNLLYDGSPFQSNKIETGAIKQGVFGFFFKFCPRFPFC